MKKLKKRNTIFYVIAEELFDIIHQEHLGVWHDVRDITYKKVQYSNICKETVQLYVRLMWELQFEEK